MTGSVPRAIFSPQGVQEFPKRIERMPGPIRILWAARWEHDKNPDAFFLALKSLKLSGVDFRISVIGEQFRERPPIFDWARQYFFHHIDRWGFQESRQDYEEALMEADVFVSTANHEFFGITAVEAIAAGAFPLLPNRLAYPEILDTKVAGDMSSFFYERESDGLADRLRELSESLPRAISGRATRIAPKRPPTGSPGTSWPPSSTRPSNRCVKKAVGLFGCCTVRRKAVDPSA